MMIHRIRRMRFVRARKVKPSNVPTHSYTTEDGMLKISGSRDTLEYRAIGEIDASHTCLNRSQIVISPEKNCKTAIVNKDTHFVSEYVPHNLEYYKIDNSSCLLSKQATNLSQKE